MLVLSLAPAGGGGTVTVVGPTTRMAAGGSITVSTAMEEQPDSGLQPRLLCSILDSGEGISDEYLKEAFELFKTTKQSGTGLGLSLSRRIMQQNGGDIIIRRPDGGGTEIRLYFPIS